VRRSVGKAVGEVGNARHGIELRKFARPWIVRLRLAQAAASKQDIIKDYVRRLRPRAWFASYPASTRLKNRPAINRRSRERAEAPIRARQTRNDHRGVTRKHRCQRPAEGFGLPFNISASEERIRASAPVLKAHGREFRPAGWGDVAPRAEGPRNQP